ncbi:MAG: hypothetical protein QM752_05935 [Gammaproteobacteria bacterium]
MAISKRGVVTFATSVLGSLICLAISIGFIYLTLPTTGGLILAALAGAATAYLGSLMLYNVFILQNQKKINAEPAQNTMEETQPSPAEIKKNKAKAYLFAFITTSCILLVAATNAVTTYQSGLLLGEALVYPSQVVLAVSIAFAAILGLSVLLAGYDQTHKFFALIKGEKPEAAPHQDYQYRSLPQESLENHHSAQLVQKPVDSKSIDRESKQSTNQDDFKEKPPIKNIYLAPGRFFEEHQLQQALHQKTKGHVKAG